MASTTSFLCRWSLQTLFQLRFFCLRQLSSSLTESAECFRDVPFSTTGRTCQDVRRCCSDFLKVSRLKAPLSRDTTFVDYRPVATYREQALLPAGTDRFFNGLLDNITLDLVRSTFMAQRPRTTFSSPSLTTVSLSRFQA